MQIGTHDGRALGYNETAKAFDADGTPITPEQVIELDEAGGVTWLSDELRNWAHEYAVYVSTAAATPMTPSLAETASTKPNLAAVPPHAADSEASWGWVIAGGAFGLVMGVLGLVFGSGLGGFILYVGFGFLLGVASRWVALDAKSRGMDGGWAIGTFLLAVVFFPAYLFQRSRTEIVEGTKVCPACAERVKAEANTCRYCGADVSSVASDRRVPDVLSQLRRSGFSAGTVDPAATEKYVTDLLSSYGLKAEVDMLTPVWQDSQVPQAGTLVPEGTVVRVNLKVAA